MFLGENDKSLQRNFMYHSFLDTEYVNIQYVASYIDNEKIKYKAITCNLYSQIKDL